MALPRWTWKRIFAVDHGGRHDPRRHHPDLGGRGAFEDALAHATFRPLSSGLIGLVTLIVLPIVAALLMATLIGFSFGLALLLLIPFLLVGGPHGGGDLHRRLDLRPDRRAAGAGRLFLYLLAGAIVMALVWLIPWAGPTIVWLAILVGTGAWFRSVWSRLRRRSAVA